MAVFVGCGLALAAAGLVVGRKPHTVRVGSDQDSVQPTASTEVAPATVPPVVPHVVPGPRRQDPPAKKPAPIRVPPRAPTRSG